MASQFNAEDADNLEDIEKQFAVKAVEQAQTYWMLLERVGGSKLKLTGCDDEIYDDFVATFPEYLEDPSQKLDEAKIKSKDGKEKWRKFIERYEKKVPDYNFGTLLRLDAAGEYDQDNTMFALRTQFYAFEIFRNRHGLNDWVKK